MNPNIDKPTTITPPSSPSNILLNKYGLVCCKEGSHEYSTTFIIKNNNIVLSSIIHFDLIEVIYRLNPDIYEHVHLEKINDNEATVVCIFKHLFEDLGLPQTYSYLRIVKRMDNDTIIFTTESIYSQRPSIVPTNAMQAPLHKLSAECTIINPHEVHFKQYIFLNPKFNLPPFLEKIIITILSKLFKRVKQFIENIT
jgi:hypothetical protein